MLEWSVDGDGRCAHRAIALSSSRGPTGSSRRRSLHSRGVTVVAGGEQRSDSVRAGVARQRLTWCSFMMRRARSRRRHSQMRLPRRPPSTARQFRSCRSSTRSSVPASDGHRKSMDRDGLVRTQTPAGRAPRAAARRLRGRPASAGIHGRGGAAREPGHAVATVPGEAANLKVTEPADLEIVRAIAAAREGGSAAGAELAFRSRPGQRTALGPSLGLRLVGSRSSVRRASTAIPMATWSCTRRRPPSCPLPASATSAGSSPPRTSARGHRQRGPPG